MIYVIGDSHSRSFQGNPNFATIHVGARTAHQIVNHNDIVQDKLKNVPDGSELIWILGEIDCRIHILNKHNQTNIPISEMIDNTIERYLKYVLTFTQYNNYICNIVPVGEQGNVYRYPFYGTREELKTVFELFNTKLERHCESLNIPFLNVYDQLIGSDGYRKPELVKDAVHLTNMLAKFIYNKYFRK